METLFDFDGTLIQTISGNRDEYKEGLKNASLTKIGRELAETKVEIVIATARPLYFKKAIMQACEELGLNVKKVLPLGSMFGHKKEQGVRGLRKLSTPSRKLAIAQALGKKIVDDDEANLAALGEYGVDARTML